MNSLCLMCLEFAWLIVLEGLCLLFSLVWLQPLFIQVIFSPVSSLFSFQASDNIKVRFIYIYSPTYSWRCVNFASNLFSLYCSYWVILHYFCFYIFRLTGAFLCYFHSVFDLIHWVFISIIFLFVKFPFDASLQFFFLCWRYVFFHLL